ncbi:MAG: hypothetical protein GXP02_04450 [Alphaproteobacteria bacterium]|nr:hypothetical protein [Alphaproteobacteria bacterium]
MDVVVDFVVGCAAFFVFIKEGENLWVVVAFDQDFGFNMGGCWFHRFEKEHQITFQQWAGRFLLVEVVRFPDRGSGCGLWLWALLRQWQRGTGHYLISLMFCFILLSDRLW